MPAEMDTVNGGMKNGHCSCQSLSVKIDSVAKTIEQVTEEYSADEIFISFNGGKDCTVLLDIYIKYTKHSQKPRVIYIQPENPFPEVDDFIRSCEKIYGVQIEFVQGKLKDALEKICTENPQFKVVVMGCRRTDPFCDKLQTFQFTDKGWPKLLRVNPLLDWNYHEIWQYIRKNKIEYCRLYDEGYTSIGDRRNTKPNEHLLVANNKGSSSYRPAYELTDGDWERSGRS